MPVLVAEILQVIIALAADLPQVVGLAQSAMQIAQSGTVTPEQEAAIRAQLDAIKAQIDAA
jgi:hypothetical protein